MDEELSKAYNVTKVYENEGFPLRYRNFLLEKFIIQEKFTLECLQKIYHSGQLTGTRLLDFGCGPTVHKIASASRQFSEIILSEWSQINRREVEKWLQEDSDALDWKPMFEHCARIEGYRDLDAGATEIERRIRKAVKNVVHCDAFSKDILPAGIGEFDVINSCRCLESSCLTIKAYKEALQKMTKFLKKGGVMVMSTSLEAEEKPNQVTLPCVFLTEEIIKEALTEAGLELKDWFCWRDTETHEMFKYGGITVYYAVKR